MQGYIEQLRKEISQKFDQALEVQVVKPLTDAESFQRKADLLIKEALRRKD
jgi:hypothetical protein